MNKATLTVLAVCTGLFLFGSENAQAEELLRGRFLCSNPAGGVSGGSATRLRGPEGGGLRRSQGFATDGQGNAVRGRSDAFQTQGGARGWRRSSTSKSSDGTIQHHSSGAVSGENGTATSSGSFTRSADGTASGSHSTSASKSSGASYDGSTTYNKTDGIQHNGVCANATGAIVDCKK